MDTRQNTQDKQPAGGLSTGEAGRTRRGADGADGADGAAIGLDELANASRKRTRELLGWGLFSGNPWGDAYGVGR